MNKLRIIVTGGTFDKEYDEIKGQLYFKATHVGEMLQRGRCERGVGISEVMLIDSLDMDMSHREQIAKACSEAPEGHLVITHGTDTMVETAEYLASQALDKTIVLTGAMVPYKFGSSDGLFNLGSALAYADVLTQGVYVAMNGQVYPWDQVYKDRSLGRFRPKKA